VKNKPTVLLYFLNKEEHLLDHHDKQISNDDLLSYSTKQGNKNVVLYSEVRINSLFWCFLSLGDLYF